MTEQIICECGMLVKGSSKDHVEYNLTAHKRGRKHKELMKAKLELAKNNNQSTKEKKVKN